MNVRVRPATAADAEAMIRIHFAAIHRTAAAFYSPEVLTAWAGELTEASYEHLRQQIAMQDGRIDVVAEANSEIVAFGMVVPSRQELRAVYVDPQFGRQGIGATILSCLEEMALERGVEHLELDSSLNAEAFYSRHGYEVIERGVHRFRSGQEMASVKMSKKLSLDTTHTKRLLDDQIAYYQARAGEYDEWFLRLGRYDRGPAHRAQWFAEVEQIRSALGATLRGADVLEIACGTGLWTQLLAQNNVHVVAVDTSSAAMAINRARVGPGKVEHVLADVFSWAPTQAFDAVFFAFWLSHVPRDLFDEFWDIVRRVLKPGGKVFFVDSLLEQTSTAINHDPVDRSGIVTRKLNDGREFQIVKVFYEPVELEERLHGLGWEGWVRSTGKFFLFGEMTPR